MRPLPSCGGRIRPVFSLPPLPPSLVLLCGRSPPRPPTGGRESYMPRYWGSSRAPFHLPSSPPLLPPYVQAAGVRPLCLTVSLYPPTGPFTLFPPKPLHSNGLASVSHPSLPPLHRLFLVYSPPLLLLLYPELPLSGGVLLLGCLWGLGGGQRGGGGRRGR